MDEIFEASSEGQPLIFQVCVMKKKLHRADDWSQQLYLNKDRSQSETLIRKVEKLGAKAIMFTVDTSWDSKRTLDSRAKAPTSSGESSATVATLPVNQAISGYQDRNLTWDDIAFIRVSIVYKCYLSSSLLICIEKYQAPNHRQRNPVARGRRTLYFSWRGRRDNCEWPYGKTTLFRPLNWRPY